MKTIGEILRQARLNKKLSLKQVEKVTKIRTAFIDSIERENWEALPPFPTVLGFVKNISWALGIEEKMAVAVLRRDYPPKKLKIAPKPDVNGKLLWSPKLTFAIGVGSILLILFGYLVFQYVRFISPPKLTVESPKEGQVIVGRSINVFGATDTDAKVIVNGQPVTVSEDGKFSVSLDVVPETVEVKVDASSRSGKTTTISRRITVQN